MADDLQQGIAQLRADFHALQARMVQWFVGTAIAMANVLVLREVVLGPLCQLPIEAMRSLIDSLY